jgi:hypothetical protein
VAAGGAGWRSSESSAWMGPRWTVPCEHAPTVWALEHWFGGMINSSDTADGIPETVQQIEIAYSVDELGILIAFSPYTKWLKRGRPSIPVIGISDDDLFGLLRKAIPSS